MTINEAPWFQSPAAIGAAVLLLIGVLLVIAGATALFKGRPLRCTLRTLSGLVLALISVLLGTVSIGTYGYKALTSDELVAKIEIRPSGKQSFDARLVYPDGRADIFTLSGDEIYIDARVLKWQPLATLFGLRTMYELDRVAGRYRSVEDERNNPRTIYSLRSLYASPRCRIAIAIRRCRVRIGSLRVCRQGGEFGAIGDCKRTHPTQQTGELEPRPPCCVVRPDGAAIAQPAHARNSPSRRAAQPFRLSPSPPRARQSRASLQRPRKHR